MNTFNPQLQTKLEIGKNSYGFLPHPVIPDEVNKIVRNQTVTYQLQKESDKSLWALKVPNPGYVNVQMERVVAFQRQYGHLPGLVVANRICLLRTVFPTLITAYPALEYAILMPWVSGRTWAGVMDDEGISAQYSLEQARELALTMAHVLWSLEMNGLTHADIAGDNVVIVNPRHIELIDIENLYMNGMPLPDQPSRGWRGYQHPRLDARGQSRVDGDRFAGAILLTEMLTWWNPLVRALTEGEALFHFAENASREEVLQRLRIVRQTLRGLHSSLQDLFDRTWYSLDLAQCPDFGSWVMALLQLRWSK